MERVNMDGLETTKPPAVTNRVDLNFKFNVTRSEVLCDQIGKGLSNILPNISVTKKKSKE
jgi:hypothetical protein